MDFLLCLTRSPSCRSRGIYSQNTSYDEVQSSCIFYYCRQSLQAIMQFFNRNVKMFLTRHSSVTMKKIVGKCCFRATCASILDQRTTCNLCMKHRSTSQKRIWKLPDKRYFYEVQRKIFFEITIRFKVKNRKSLCGTHSCTISDETGMNSTGTHSGMRQLENYFFPADMVPSCA